jgi:hypothetical protein
VPDQFVVPPPQLQTDLRQLGGLARPGLPRDDHDLMIANGLRYLRALLADRQLRWIGDSWSAGHGVSHCAGSGAANLRALAD